MAFTDKIQTSFTSDPAIGSIGQIARPASPFTIEPVNAEVGSGLRNPRPGDAVARESTGGYSAVTTNVVDTAGIVYQRDGEVPRQSGSTDNQVVEYRDGEAMQIVTFGYVFLQVSTGGGNTIVAGDELEYVPANPVTGEANWQERSDSAGSNVPSTFANVAAVRTYLLTLQKYVKVIAKNETAVAASQTRVIIPAFVYPV